MTAESDIATNPNETSKKKLATLAVAIVAFVALLMCLRSIFLTGTPGDPATPRRHGIAAIEAMASRGHEGVADLMSAATASGTNRRRLAFLGLQQVGPDAQPATGGMPPRYLPCFK